MTKCAPCVQAKQKCVPPRTGLLQGAGLGPVGEILLTDIRDLLRSQVQDSRAPAQLDRISEQLELLTTQHLLALHRLENNVANIERAVYGMARKMGFQEVTLDPARVMELNSEGEVVDKKEKGEEKKQEKMEVDLEESEDEDEVQIVDLVVPAAEEETEEEESQTMRE